MLFSVISWRAVQHCLKCFSKVASIIKANQGSDFCN